IQAEEQQLRREIDRLQARKQQEQAGFHQQERRNCARLEAELAEAARQAVLGGFLPLPPGSHRVPLRPRETVRWESTALRLKQRTVDGYPYWHPDAQGTLVVTGERLLFDAPGVSPWQKPSGKLA